MSLIKSISGIRGTIGGPVDEALTPIDIVKFTAAYARQRKEKFPAKERLKVVVGRDARISGEMVDSLVCGTLLACGIDVVNAGLASTPTTEMAVRFAQADGGIILTASHNPGQWNALKLLNEKGEFLTDEEGMALQRVAAAGDFDFVAVDRLGTLVRKDFTQAHIDAVLQYPLVDVPAIRAAHFKVVLDAVNSVGALCMPPLLDALGVECVTINGAADGRFAHDPEPLPANLGELSATVVREGGDLGIAVDPDVDRLAFFCEDGTPFGEEYTLVAVADSVLSVRPGPTVSNISSSRALRDVTEAHGCRYHTCKVGEVNVTTRMQEVGAVIGGEGNGGVIVPDLHYGRDALIGTALFLSILAHKKIRVSDLRATYPDYYVSKNKIGMRDPARIEAALAAVEKHYAEEVVMPGSPRPPIKSGVTQRVMPGSDRASLNKLDGLRVDFEQERKWFILRRSNTEPIIRLYAEAPTEAIADALAQEVMTLIGS